MIRKVGKKTRKYLAFRDRYLYDKRNHEGYWVCAECKRWTAYPEVDHIKKRSTHPELVFEESNLQILCGDCHRKKHA